MPFATSCNDNLPFSVSDNIKPFVLAESVNHTICLLPVLFGICSNPPVTFSPVSTLVERLLFITLGSQKIKP